MRSWGRHDTARITENYLDDDDQLACGIDRDGRSVGHPCNWPAGDRQSTWVYDPAMLAEVRLRRWGSVGHVKNHCPHPKQNGMGTTRGGVRFLARHQGSHDLAVSVEGG